MKSSICQTIVLISMCGICGIVSWEQTPDTTQVEQMRSSLRHRGPDADGVLSDDYAVFGHTRLSIIDLSSTANQPFVDHSQRYWLVFNGEIYNYRELRRELEGLGSQFRTSSDTEVIIEGYAAWQTEITKKLDGVFAFAIWDKQEQKLFLARDRLGEKPLYYAILPNRTIAFASELPALLNIKEINKEISKSAVSDYFSLGYTLGANGIYKHISQLPPAHQLIINKNFIHQVSCYWNLATFFINKSVPANEQVAIEEFTHLFDQAVKKRLISDVPLGAFLSGGIDSSAVVYSMVQQSVAQKSKTFSIAFKEESFSEAVWSREVAKHVATDHKEEVINESLANLLPEIIKGIGEPFADTSILPMYLLAAMARKDVTVCLSGDGADELLAGYSTYQADIINQYVKYFPRPLLRTMAVLLNTLLPTARTKIGLQYKLNAFLNGISTNAIYAHYKWRELFSEEEKRLLLKPEHIKEVRPTYYKFEKLGADVKNCDLLDQLMYVDIKTWLVDDILIKVDRMTMAHGLEARPPFLDSKLVEFCASLPVNLKMKGLSQKYILKRSQQTRLPKRIINRKKSGFNAPIAHWLENSLKQYMERLLIEDHPYFQKTYVHQIWHDHLNRKADHSFRLFAIMNFDLWARSNAII